MTRNELDNHFRMIRQLHDAQEIQQSITARAEREKGDAERLAILSECLDDIGQRIAQYEHLLAELSPDVVAFINSVRASRVRQVLRLRFLHGLAWCEIPCFVGVGVTEASCKTMCYRYLREHCKAEPEMPKKLFC